MIYTFTIFLTFCYSSLRGEALLTGISRSKYNGLCFPPFFLRL